MAVEALGMVETRGLVAAIEAPFFGKNVQSMLKLAHE